MEAEGKRLTIDELSTSINIRPENCLNLLYLRVRYSDATEEQEEKLLTFAKYIGLAFQIRDDILDVEGTEEEIENRLVAIFLMKRAHIQRCLL